MTKPKSPSDGVAGLKGHGGEQARYVPNRLVVKLKPEYYGSRDAQREVLGRLPQDCHFESEFDELGIAVISLPSGADPLKIAQEIGRHDMVEFAEPDFLDSGTS